MATRPKTLTWNKKNNKISIRILKYTGRWKDKTKYAMFERMITSVIKNSKNATLQMLNFEFEFFK